MNDERLFEDIALEGQDKIDLTEIIKDDKNVFLIDDKNTGGFLFHQISEGIYESHPQFLPESRGKYAFKHALESLEYMFKKTNCMEVYAVAPKEYVNSKMLAKYCGFEKVDQVKKDYRLKNASGIYDVYLLTFNKWREKWQ